MSVMSEPLWNGAGHPLDRQHRDRERLLHQMEVTLPELGHGSFPFVSPVVEYQSAKRVTIGASEDRRRRSGIKEAAPDTRGDHSRSLRR